MAKTEYSNSDIMMMQQDAIKRVMDMNRRAQQTINRANEERNGKPVTPQEPFLQQSHDEQEEDMNNREYYRQRNTDNCRQQNTDNYKKQQYTNQRNYTNNRTQYNRQQNRGYPFFGMRGPSYERPQTHRQSLPLQKDPSPPQKANIFEGILDRIGLDSEVVLLLLLVFMLANEGADISLLLALGYIIL